MSVASRRSEHVAVAAAGTPVLLDERLPVAPGTSRFRVKGHVYAKMKDDVERTVPGGIDALAERLDDAAVREFVQQRFFASVWYDALPMTPLAVTHARLVGVPMHQHCREKGRTIAGQDVPGIYRALLRLFSPRTLVGRLPKAATFYFDFGDTSVEWTAEHVARVRLAGVPCSLAPMLAGVIEGFTAQALELSGAKAVQVRTLDVVHDGGAAGGVATAAIRHECSWSA